MSQWKIMGFAVVAAGAGMLRVATALTSQSKVQLQSQDLQSYHLRLHATPSIDQGAPAFPPGRNFAPSLFWGAAPSTQDSSPLPGDRIGPSRLRADFVKSGEADMLAWSPPASAEYINPFANTMTLVRFLGGLRTTDFPGSAPDVTQGDVVYRQQDGSLAMRWELVYERLDPFVNNSIQPVIVLDNVPWCFVDNNTDHNTDGFYGNNMGPDNITE